jgi:hypothetical protein
LTKAWKRHFIEEKQLEENNQLIKLEYLFDWGSRLDFNRDFHRNWFEILEHDPKFKKYALKIKLNSKHCYSSNMLLAQIKKS